MGQVPLSLLQVINVTGISIGSGLASACDTLMTQVSSSSPFPVSPLVQCDLGTKGRAVADRTGLQTLWLEPAASPRRSGSCLGAKRFAICKLHPTSLVFASAGHGKGI